MPLTPEDDFAIRELYARYNAYVDTGAYQDWANCFTEDGVFSPAVVSGGRAAITALGKARLEARASQEWKEPQHWNSSLVLNGQGDEARAVCYIMRVVKNKNSGGSEINVLGMYEDRLVRIDGRWYFKSRKVQREPLPPQSVPSHADRSNPAG